MGQNCSLELFVGQTDVMDDGAKFFLVLTDGKTRCSKYSCDLRGAGAPSLGGCCSPGLSLVGRSLSMEVFKTWPDKTMADPL